MLLALIERKTRRSLNGKPIRGLYPENRLAMPTGPAILNCFSTLCVVTITHNGAASRHLSQPTAIQKKLLMLLDIPPTVLTTFKRGCGM